MRIDDEAKYREGVVLDRPMKLKAQGGSYVNAGLRKASIAMSYSNIVTSECQCNN